MTLISFKRSGDGWLGVAIRLLLFIATICYCIYLTTVPGLMADITEAGLRTHDDLKSWGIDKIAFNFTNINKHSLTHDVSEDESPDSTDFKNETELLTQNNTDFKTDELMSDSIQQEYTETL